MGHAGWLSNVCEPAELKKTAESIAKFIEVLKKTQKFNCIASTGLSGNAMASVVSYITGIPVIYVRKPEENRHSDNKIEFSQSLKGELNYIIVDDFVSSGATARNIIFALNTFAEKEKWTATCVGFIAYRRDYNQEVSVSETPGAKKITAWGLDNRKNWE